jgi:hypothetical protein
MEKPVASNLSAAQQQVNALVKAPPAPQADTPKAMAAPTQNAIKPNKNAFVPKSGYVMASDPRVSEALEAFLSNKETKKIICPNKSRNQH